MQTEPGSSEAVMTESGAASAATPEPASGAAQGSPANAVEDYLGSAVETLVNSSFWENQVRGRFGLFPVVVGISIIALGIAVLRRNPQTRASASRLPGTPTLDAPLRKKTKS